MAGSVGEMRIPEDGRRAHAVSRGICRLLARNDIWALPLPVSQGTTPVRVTNTLFIEANAVLSPDGRWIAYQSNESGVAQPDVYIQPFPTGDRRQVSSNGGSMPRWGHDGRELFYVGPDSTLMSVTVAASA